MVVVFSYFSLINLRLYYWVMVSGFVLKMKSGCLLIRIGSSASVENLVGVEKFMNSVMEVLCFG